MYCIDDSAIFSKITYVRALELGKCMLPDTLNTLKHLRYLSIEDDKIESLPESLCILYYLQTLDINCHNILELPENIKTLINLRFLRLCSNKIKQLPESISLLHNLDTLSVEYCSYLEKLPRKIEQLTNLRVLKLAKLYIFNLPSLFGKLTNLRTLDGLFKVMGSDMTRGLGELRDMNRLDGLMSISGLKNIGNVEYSRKANLISKSNLRKLILNFDEDDDSLDIYLRHNDHQVFYIAVNSRTNARNENDEKIQEGVLESLQPHGNLTELEILNYGGRKVPHWLLDPSLMSKLTTLTLHFHMELTFLPPLLDQLLHLKSLKICWSGDIVQKVGGDELRSKFQLANYSFEQLAGVSFLSREEPSFNNKLNLGEGQEGDEPCLKKLILNKCPKLWKVTIPQKVMVLEVNACGCQEIKFSSPSELKKRSISNCRELITICYKSEDLPILVSISLSGCPKLLMLSAIPQELKHLDIADCGFQEINFPSLSKVQKISIFDSRELRSIYYKIGDLPFLESISLSRCPNLSMLSTIPQKVEMLEVNACGCQEIQFSSPSELKKLSISNCRELITIYYKSGDLPFLKSISLSGCPNLVMPLAIPQKVEVLKVKACGCQEIKFSSPSELKQLDIADCSFIQEINLSSLSKLQKLSISKCRDLITIYYKSGDLPFLESISLSGCPNLLMLSAIPQELKQLYIKDCGFQEINFSSLSKLQKISIFDCRGLVSIYYKIGDLPFLESISLSGCPNLSMPSTIPQRVEMLEVNACRCQEIMFSSPSELKKLSISNCAELITIYYKIGNLPFLESISLYKCPKLLIFSVIPEEMKQMDKRNSGFQSEIQNVSMSDNIELSPPFMRRVLVDNCPKLRIFSAVPTVELDTLNISHCSIHEIILPSRCQHLVIENCPELISVHWRDGDSSSLRQVTFDNCPQLKLLKIPKEVEALLISSCSTREIFVSSQSKINFVHIYGCPELVLVHWMDGDVPFLKNLSFNRCPALGSISALPNKILYVDIIDCGLHEIRLPKQCKIASVHISGCPQLISLQFLQGDLPLLERFTIKNCPQFHEVLTIPHQLKELKIVDCCFPEIHLLPQSKLRRLIISECAKLTAIKGLQVQFPMGDVSHPMMEMVDIRNCPRMDFGTQGNSYFYQVTQEDSQDLSTGAIVQI